MEKNIPCTELPSGKCPIECKKKICNSPTALYKYKMKQLFDLLEQKEKQKHE